MINLGTELTPTPLFKKRGEKQNFQIRCSSSFFEREEAGR